MSGLNGLQRTGLNRLGDCYAPGGKVTAAHGSRSFPSFSELGCIEHADRVLDYLPAADRNDLKLLLGILALSPPPVLKGFVWLLEHSESGLFSLGPVGSLLRLIRLGLKGLVFSLYYSGMRGSRYTGPTPVELLGYDAKARVT